MSAVDVIRDEDLERLERNSRAWAYLDRLRARRRQRRIMLAVDVGLLLFCLGVAAVALWGP